MQNIKIEWKPNGITGEVERMQRYGLLEMAQYYEPTGRRNIVALERDGRKSSSIRIDGRGFTSLIVL
jgi:hypothetical protein